MDRIVSDLVFDSFADAAPAFDRVKSSVEPGMTVTLQHGARVIRSSI